MGFWDLVLGLGWSLSFHKKKLFSLLHCSFVSVFVSVFVLGNSFIVQHNLQWESACVWEREKEGMGSRCRCRSSLRSFVALAAHSGRKGMSSSCSLHLEEKKEETRSGKREYYSKMMKTTQKKEVCLLYRTWLTKTMAATIAINIDTLPAMLKMNMRQHRLETQDLYEWAHARTPLQVVKAWIVCNPRGACACMPPKIFFRKSLVVLTSGSVYVVIILVKIKRPYFNHLPFNTHPCLFFHKENEIFLLKVKHSKERVLDITKAACRWQHHLTTRRYDVVAHKIEWW